MSIDSCRVHGLKSSSKFQSAVNQLRRENEFSLDILYKQLPNKCCSCFEEASLKRLNLDILRQICLDLFSSCISSVYEKDTTKSISTKIEKSRKKRMLKHDISYDLKKQLDEYSDEISDQEYSDEEKETSISQLSNGMIRPKFRSGRTSPYRQLRHSSRMRPKIMRRYPVLNNFPRRPLQSAGSIGIDDVNSHKNRYIVLLEQFKVIQVPDSCIVHDRKYLSRFHFVLNLLRCKNEFPGRIYHQLPNTCCSCEGREGLHVIDPTILHKMCEEIQLNSAVQQTSEKHFDWLVLQYKPLLDSEARQSKTGQFIGQNGQNLRSLQDQYNIRINIINKSSSAKLRERSDVIRAEHENNLDGLVLSFSTRNQSINSTISIEEIKQKLTEAWDAAREDAPPTQ